MKVETLLILRGSLLTLPILTIHSDDPEILNLKKCLLKTLLRFASTLNCGSICELLPCVQYKTIIIKVRGFHNNFLRILKILKNQKHLSHKFW